VVYNDTNMSLQFIAYFQIFMCVIKGFDFSWTVTVDWTSKFEIDI